MQCGVGALSAGGNPSFERPRAEENGRGRAASEIDSQNRIHASHIFPMVKVRSRTVY